MITICIAAAAVISLLSGSAIAESGIASVYTYGPTASGRPFNRNAMTAAHRTLPFGSKVLVTNKRNGRSVVVTITDRGPFVRGRIIDLTPGAAARIGLGHSITPVTIGRL